MNPKKFFGELKRRNVYKVAIAYGVVAWLLIQVATQVFPFFEIPNWAVRLVVLLLLIGFPVALLLAWAFELTPQGIKRTEEVAPNESIRHRTGRKIVAVTVTLTVIAAALLAFRLSRQEPPAADAFFLYCQGDVAHSREIDRGLAIRESEQRQRKRLLCRRAGRDFGSPIQDRLISR